MLSSLGVLTPATSYSLGPAVGGAPVTAMAPCYADIAWVLPCDNAITLAPGTGTTVPYQLTNSAAFDDYWQVITSCDGATITSCTPSSVWVMVPAHSTVQYVVSISAGSAAGTGWVALEIETSGTHARLYTTTTVTVNYAQLSLDVSYATSKYRSPSLCAAACFAVTHAQSTVPFFSLDSPASITLVYNSDRALPRPFVYADVTFGSNSQPVSEYWLDVQVNGAPATFVNGNSGRLYFQGSSGSVRLGGQIDATAMATDVYPMTVTVTAVRAGGNEVLTTSTELIVVNESSSQVAAGWTIAGQQRLHWPTTGGYLVTEGDGTAVRYPDGGVYAADFSYIRDDGITFTRHYPDGGKVVFYRSGLHDYTVDRRGRTFSFVWSGGRLAAITNPARDLGMGTPYHSLSYDANGLSAITEVSQSGPSRTTGVTVDAARRLTRVTDPDSFFSHFGYDANNRLSTVTDRRGGVSQYVYAASSWRIAEHRLPQVEIDVGGGNTSPAQPTVTFDSWQTRGVPTSFTSSSSPAPPAPLGTITGTVTDPEGAVTTFSVNTFGQARSTTDPSGRTSTVSFDGIRPTSVTRPDGGIDYFSWSGPHLAWMRPSGGAPQSFSYGVFGQLEQVWGPGTREERRFLDPANGNIDSVRYAATDQPAQMIRYRYVGATNALRQIIDAFGHETLFEYESVFANVRRIVAPGNRATEATFDSHGRMSTVTPAGRPTQTIQYDVVNRPRFLYDGVNSQPVTIAYDALFQTSVTDQKSQIYRTWHNALGWLTSEMDPLTEMTTLRYDRRGLVTSTTNRRGQRVDMTYDNLGRILSKTGANTTSDYFSYSTDRRITVAWNSVARDSMFFDPFTGADSTVIRLQPPPGGRERRFVISHSNNPDLATPDTVRVGTVAGSPERIYTWDATTGALRYFAFAGQNPLSMAHNMEQLRTRTTFPNSSGMRTENHTSLHDVIQAQFSAGNLNSAFYRGYEYDDRGRVKSVLNGPAGSTRQIYTYDNLGRLSSRVVGGNCSYQGENADVGVISSCGSTIGSESFTYDEVGNRTDLGGSAGLGNRIQSFNGTTFAHDADGNVTQKYKPNVYNRLYWWSAESRLDSAQYNNWTKVKYDYDALGRPVRKWRGDPNSGWVFDRYWVYDGDQRVISFDANMSRIEEYAYAPGIDRPIATIRGSSSVDAYGYHVQDELGNVLGIIEDGAYISQTLSYDAWGMPTESGHAYNNQLFWKSAKWEGDVISLYYMRNRWYDPETGRFMSEDPIGLAGGINQYTFANNDPVNGWDPYGLIPCTPEAESAGYVTSFGSNGAWWCVPPTALPPVTIHGDGGGSGVAPYTPWDNWNAQGRGASGPTGPGRGGVGGGGRGTGSSNISGEANRRIQNEASCIMNSAANNYLQRTAVVGAYAPFAASVLGGTAANYLSGTTGFSGVAWQWLTNKPIVGRIGNWTFAGVRAVVPVARGVGHSLAARTAWATGTALGDLATGIGSCM